MASQEKKSGDLDLLRIEALLAARGARMTPPRARVLKVLLQADGPLKAYDILGKLKGMQAMTVYRALDFFVAQGLAHRIESLNAYVSCGESHCAHRDSQYLICEKCGTAQELHNHAIDDFIAKNLKASGFQPSYKVMEIHGTCRVCKLG